MYTLMVVILISLIIAYGVRLIMRLIPIMKLTLQIQRMKHYLKRVSRYFHSIERKFIRDEKFRESYVEDPKKLSGFFKVVDQVNNTEFCNGLTTDELSGLFEANPEIMPRRVEEYLSYRKAVRV